MSHTATIELRSRTKHGGRLQAARLCRRRPAGGDTSDYVAAGSRPPTGKCEHSSACPARTAKSFEVGVVRQGWQTGVHASVDNFGHRGAMISPHRHEGRETEAGVLHSPPSARHRIRGFGSGNRNSRTGGFAWSAQSRRADMPQVTITIDAEGQTTVEARATRAGVQGCHGCHRAGLGNVKDDEQKPEFRQSDAGPVRCAEQGGAAMTTINVNAGRLAPVHLD